MPCQGKRNGCHPRGARTVHCCHLVGRDDSARQTGLNRDSGAPNAAAPCRGAHPALAQHPAGASPSWKQQARASHRQHPRPRGQVQNRAAATLSQIKFFHSMWTNLFAVAGTREHPPAGVIRKRGRSAPSCVPAAHSREYAVRNKQHGKFAPAAQTKGKRAAESSAPTRLRGNSLS